MEMWAYIVYMGVSIPLGILMSVLIEYPVLRFRDRIFPPLEVVHVPAGAVEGNGRAVAAAIGPI